MASTGYNWIITEKTDSDNATYNVGSLGPVDKTNVEVTVNQELLTTFTILLDLSVLYSIFL